MDSYDDHFINKLVMACVLWVKVTLRVTGKGETVTDLRPHVVALATILLNNK